MLCLYDVSSIGRKYIVYAYYVVYLYIYCYCSINAFIVIVTLYAWFTSIFICISLSFHILFVYYIQYSTSNGIFVYWKRERESCNTYLPRAFCRTIEFNFVISLFLSFLPFYCTIFPLSIFFYTMYLPVTTNKGTFSLISPYNEWNLQFIILKLLCKSNILLYRIV